MVLSYLTSGGCQRFCRHLQSREGDEALSIMALGLVLLNVGAISLTGAEISRNFLLSTTIGAVGISVRGVLRRAGGRCFSCGTACLALGQLCLPLSFALSGILSDTLQASLVEIGAIASIIPAIFLSLE